MIGSIPRWDGSQKIERDDALFTGDAIADLRTQGNTLSVWYSKDGSDLNDILVALALSRSRIEKLCYVILDDVVTKSQLETLIRDYINNGIVDVSQLTDGIRTSLKL